MTPRIAMVTPGFQPYAGGVETHVLEVGRRLASRCRLTVLTTDPWGKLPPTEFINGMEIRRFKSWPRKRDYFFAPAVLRAVARGKWDLVHCQGYHTFVAPLGMLGAIRAESPFIVTLHSGGPVSRMRQLLRRPQHAVLVPLLRRAAAVVAVSRFEAEHLGPRLRLKPNQVVVIPNGSDLPPSSNLRGRKEGLLVSVGRLERYKGHQRVIASLPYVRRSRPDASLLVVGSGPYGRDLAQLVSRLGLHDHVRFTSLESADRTGLSDILSRASVFVSASEYESQGVAALEAVSASCPIVVTEGTALAELAESGSAIAVSKTAGPQELAAAIIAQLEHPRTSAARSLPTWDDCADKTWTLYKAVLRLDA
jgi:glycosyltransferase involved in cell wall biosynthesis